MRSRLEKFLNDCWYRNRHPAVVACLMPLSWLYRVVVALRGIGFHLGLFPQYRMPVPVIVVGNLTVGGTGKTPLVTWVVNFLKEKGFAPCVISRGYGGQARQWPQQVRSDSDPMMVGDEPLVLARHCECPVGVSPDRAAGAKALLKHESCDVLVCDDGLQHYALERDIEIVVVDGVRRFGNRHLLPAGPLREPLSRMNDVDLVVTNGLGGRHEFPMDIRPDDLRNVSDERITRGAEELKGRTVHAVAGIGNPERFFSQLDKMGMTVIEHAFPDHHVYVANELRFDDEHDVIMTEKDAVKCRRFAEEHWWYLPVVVEMHEHFGHRLLALLDEVNSNG